MTIPEIVVESDYDGYFEGWVREWCEKKQGEFKNKTIVISAGPWRSCAVSYRKIDDDKIAIDFYSALRTGFGHFSEKDELALIELL